MTTVVIAYLTFSFGIGIVAARAIYRDAPNPNQALTRSLLTFLIMPLIVPILAWDFLMSIGNKK